MEIVDKITSQEQKIKNILGKGGTVIISQNKNGIVLYENIIKKIK